MSNNGNGNGNGDWFGEFKKYVIENKPVLWTKVCLVPRYVRAFTYDSGEKGLSVKTTSVIENEVRQLLELDESRFSHPLIIVDRRPLSIIFHDRLQKENRESLSDFLRVFNQPAGLSFRLRKSQQSGKEYFSVMLENLPSGINPRWLFGSYCFGDPSGVYYFQINKQKSLHRFLHSIGKAIPGYSIWLTALTGNEEPLVVEKVLTATGEIVEEIEIGQTIERRQLALSAA